MICTLLDLESVELLVLELEGEPHCREVAPAELAQNDVLVVEDLAIQKKWRRARKPLFG